MSEGRQSHNKLKIKEHMDDEIGSRISKKTKEARALRM